jgi:hypothetical protein
MGSLDRGLGRVSAWAIFLADDAGEDLVRFAEYDEDELHQGSVKNMFAREKAEEVAKGLSLDRPGEIFALARVVKERAKAFKDGKVWP